MLKTFINYLQFEKRSSPHTVTSYSTDLFQFQDFLLKHCPPTTIESVTYPEIRQWIIELVEAGIEPRSVNRKIASLRAFYKFFLKKEAIAKDPTLKLKPLKTKKQIPHFVEEQQMINLLDEEEEENEFVALRNKLIMELFYGTGIRLSEIISLKNGNINLYQSVIKVTGKRNKERVIPINDLLRDLIKTYNEKKATELLGKECQNLIVTKRGDPAYPKMVYRIVKGKLNMIQNLDKRSPHILRHTFATHLLDNGADLNAIKDLLGHTSLAATQVYTHNSMEKIKAIFNQAHPKAHSKE